MLSGSREVGWLSCLPLLPGSHVGFTQFTANWEKSSAKYRKNSALILVFFKGFGKEIVYNKTKFTTQKNWLSVQMAFEKLKIEMFFVPSSATAKIWGHTATKIP